MYASRATEFGRGNKITKFSDAPDWTPAPNAYTLKTDFVNYFDSDMSAFNLEMDILRQFSKLGIRWSSSSSEVLFME